TTSRISGRSVRSSAWRTTMCCRPSSSRTTTRPSGSFSTPPSVYHTAPVPTSYRLGVDIGGTFTDLVLVDEDGRVETHQLSSTPEDYGRAILDGVRALLADADLAPQQARELVHGTTVAT